MEFNIERFTKHQTGQPSTHAIAINWPKYQNFQHYLGLVQIVTFVKYELSYLTFTIVFKYAFNSSS